MDTEEVARLRLEKSLTLHRAKIEVLRQLESKLDARITRLSELSTAAKTLIESMMTNPFQLEVEIPQIHSIAPAVEPLQPVQPAPTLPELESQSDEGRKGSKSPGGCKRSVSWVSEPLHEEVTLNNKDTPKIPVHGHWVPQDVLERRASFQGETAQKMGGRQLELQTSSGAVPCLLVEPMGELINQEFVSTAMAIIFEHRFVTDPKAMDEWAQVLKRTKLLDAGVSVAMPMLSPELDLTEVVQAIMKFCSNDLCILSGKGPGAARALDAAAKGGTDATVAACLLFAPEPPAPERCGYEGPVMLVWAQDDQDSPFDQAGLWAEALALRDGGTAIAVLRDPTLGGHDLGRMLRKDEACAADILSFVAASLLLIELRRLDGSQLQKDRLLRLFEELPLHLTQQFARRRLNGENLEGKHADDLAVALVSHMQDAPTALEIASSLSEWINNDMQRPMVSASE